MTAHLKFRIEENFENTDYRGPSGVPSEIYKTEFPLSYSESVAGKALFQAKMFEQGGFINRELVKLYWQNRNNVSIEMFYDLVHPESLVGKHLLYRRPEKTLLLLYYYTR